MRRSSYVVVALVGLVGACVAQDPALTSAGSTYGRAQVTAWVAPQVFAVARWDATVSLFRPPRQGEYGPVLVGDATVPSLQAVQMITPVDARTFVTSNDDHSLSLWSSNGTSFAPSTTLGYGTSLGIANSGVIVSGSGGVWLVTGHEQGYVGIWKVDHGAIAMTKVVSVRSPNPIPSPYKLWNVRGVAVAGDGRVATGSEDGDIAILSIPDGTIIARRRYNPSAQRGINAISTNGDLLLVANCSVGSTDKNLWLFRLTKDAITPLDGVELQHAAGLPQVFDFSTSFVTYLGVRYFVASTQEGLLWLGKVAGDKLLVLSNVTVAPEGGAAVSVDPTSQQVAAVAFDVELFAIKPPPSQPH